MSSEEIRAATEMVRSAVGESGLAGLVNNAGIVVAGPLEFVPLEEIRRQLEVNVILLAVFVGEPAFRTTARGLRGWAFARW
jgi:NAD(P)-dependent dehydrogenase (short-subunit alcohol dehydrogenase family)